MINKNNQKIKKKTHEQFLTQITKSQILICEVYVLLPSYTGTTCETPSPASNTIPVVLPEEYNDSTACIPT